MADNVTVEDVEEAQPRDNMEMYEYEREPRARDFENESERSYDSGLRLINQANQNLVYDYNDFDVGSAVGKASEMGTYMNGPSHAGSDRGKIIEGSVSGHSYSQSATTIADKPFTVERKDQDSHMHRWYKKPSRALSLLKLLLALILACVTLFCVVASKLSILSIAKRLAVKNVPDPKNNVTDKYACSENNLSGCQRETSFVMLCLVLMIPPAYTLLTLFITTCRKITHPWPTKLAILWVSIFLLLLVLVI